MNENDAKAILKIRAPIIVEVGRRTMTIGSVLELSPGALIELGKRAEGELDLMVNNRRIGLGSAVKIGENFGLRVTYVGTAQERLEAVLGSNNVEAEDADITQLAADLLAG